MDFGEDKAQEPVEKSYSVFAATPRRRVWKDEITYLLKPSCVTLEAKSDSLTLVERRTTKGSKSSSHLEL